MDSVREGGRREGYGGSRREAREQEQQEYNSSGFNPHIQHTLEQVGYMGIP